MCKICESGEFLPDQEREILINTAVVHMATLAMMPLEALQARYANTLFNFIGMQDTLISLLIQTGNFDPVKRIIGLMRQNVEFLRILTVSMIDRLESQDVTVSPSDGTGN